MTTDSPGRRPARHGLEVVFLDRDGTLNRDDGGYLADPDGLELLPGAAEAVAALNAAGVKAVVVTNQSGVGRGLIAPDALRRVHARLIAQLAERGAALDGIYVCPHRPEEGCACRKPGAELALRAARELGVDPSWSAMIGDKAVDVELGRRLGGLSVLVRTGQGCETEAGVATGPKPDYIACDVREAVAWLLSPERAARRLKRATDPPGGEESVTDVHTPDEGSREGRKWNR